eukprot:6640531-Prymnesium_polylepis.1
MQIWHSRSISAFTSTSSSVIPGRSRTSSANSSMADIALCSGIRRACVPPQMRPWIIVARTVARRTAAPSDGQSAVTSA